MKTIEDRARDYAKQCEATFPNICAHDYAAGAKEEHILLTEWRDPDDDPPQHSHRVLVKLVLHNRWVLYTSGWYSDGSEPLDGGKGWSHDLYPTFPDAILIGWREVVDE